MNTVYPNKRRRTRVSPGPPSNTTPVVEIPTPWRPLDLGGGFWGFEPGLNVQVTLDVPVRFNVIGNTGVNPFRNVGKLVSGFIVIY